MRRYVKLGDEGSPDFQIIKHLINTSFPGGRGIHQPCVCECLGCVGHVKGTPRPVVVFPCVYLRYHCHYLSVNITHLLYSAQFSGQRPNLVHLVIFATLNSD